MSLTFLKFLKVLGLDSSRVSMLLNLLWCYLKCECLPRCLGVGRNTLGRLLFIGVWGWVSDMWWNLIGDICHNLIGGALRLFLQDTWYGLIDRNIFIFKMTHVSNRLDHLCYCLHASMCGLCHFLHVSMCDWFLHAFISMTLGKSLLVFDWW